MEEGEEEEEEAPREQSSIYAIWRGNEAKSNISLSDHGPRLVSFGYLDVRTNLI